MGKDEGSMVFYIAMLITIGAVLLFANITVSPPEYHIQNMDKAQYDTNIDNVHWQKLITVHADLDNDNQVTFCYRLASIWRWDCGDNNLKLMKLGIDARY